MLPSERSGNNTIFWPFSIYLFMQLSFFLLPLIILTQFDALDWQIMDDPAEVAAISNAVSVSPVSLTSDEVAEIVEFLAALTDTSAQMGRLGVPKSVPSGLAIPNP